MGLFGRRKLNLDDFEARCIEIFKSEVLQASDDYHAVSTTYLANDAAKRNVLDARGPESIYALTIHVMTHIIGYQLTYAEGRRASDGVVNKLFKWVFYAGSFERPPIEFSHAEFKKLNRDTTDRSIKYHNEVLNKDGQLVQQPAILDPIDYLEQKAVLVFKNELSRQLGVSNINELNPDLVAALLKPIYRLHETFEKFIDKNQIKPSR